MEGEDDRGRGMRGWSSREGKCQGEEGGVWRRGQSEGGDGKDDELGEECTEGLWGRGGNGDNECRGKGRLWLGRKGVLGKDSD